MSAGDLTARHYVTGQPVRLRWEDSRITELKDSESCPPNLWVAPALVDLQVNGYAGVDFQRDDLSLDELLAATRHLRADGCARYLLTLITDDWAKLLVRFRHHRALRRQSSELQHAIAGWHIEGPFLSAVPGFCGAHDPAHMIDPTPRHLQELRGCAQDDRVLLTLAPEREGALDAIPEAVRLGLRVSLGHTNAPAEVLAEAVRRGACAFTHLGNGCPRDLDRHDNILWRVFETPGLTISLIPDTTHVSPALFRLTHRLVNPASIYYTTDAMSAAGGQPGRYRLGRLELEVGADQIVRLPGTPNFAGSALRPFEGVFRAARMLGRTWREVWNHAALVPAQLMDLAHSLEVDAPPEFCVLEFSESGELLQINCPGR